MELLKGAETAKTLTKRAKEIVQTLPRAPKLAIIRFGENESDISYETGAKKRMDKCGIDCVSLVYPSDIDPERFFSEFEALNRDSSVDGILVLQPLPKSIDGTRLFGMMDPEKDMDCATKENRLRLFEGRETVFPCTPEAVIRMMEHRGIDPSGKRAVVIGRSMVVGKPLAMMLLGKNATVTICHSRTRDLPAVCREADILVTAIGRAEMIDGSYIKPGAAVFDVGINMNASGALVGDCRQEEMQQASLLTPVPGGVGSVTTSVLALHTAEAAAKKLL